jgi:hypothetical protein
MLSIGLAGSVFAETPSTSQDKSSSASTEKSGQLKTSDLPQPVQDAGRAIKRVAKELEKATRKVIQSGKAAVKEITKKESEK